MEVEFPTPLLEPHVVVGGKVHNRSDHIRTVFRAGSESFKQALRPREKKEMFYGYRVDQEIYRRRDEFFSQVARAQLSVAGEVVAIVERPIVELQDF